MAKRIRKQDKVGRPAIYEGERRPITVLWPVEIVNYVDLHTDNRTKWLIEAAREKMEREQSNG
jgi:hypothetical protein